MGAEEGEIKFSYFGDTDGAHILAERIRTVTAAPNAGQYRSKAFRSDSAVNDVDWRRRSTWGRNKKTKNQRSTVESLVWKFAVITVRITLSDWVASVISRFSAYFNSHSQFPFIFNQLLSHCVHIEFLLRFKLKLELKKTELQILKLIPILLKSILLFNLKLKKK